MHNHSNLNSTPITLTHFGAGQVMNTTGGTVENGVVTSCSRIGGSHAWQLYSISRWSREDGAKLRRHLEEEFEQKQNRQIYWDDVALFCHPAEYQLGVREMRREDIIEIDDLRELAAMDAAYAPLLKKEDS